MLQTPRFHRSRRLRANESMAKRIEPVSPDFAAESEAGEPDTAVSGKTMNTNLSPVPVETALMFALAEGWERFERKTA